MTKCRNSKSKMTKQPIISKQGRMTGATRQNPFKFKPTGEPGHQYQDTCREQSRPCYRDAWILAGGTLDAPDIMPAGGMGTWGALFAPVVFFRE
jgi:hypothetical protein